jgi:cysteine-rich repeat protein
LALLLALQVGPASAGAVCGDGVIDLGEECDDGAVADLDGCTRTCRYEAIQHVDSLALHAGSAPSFCVPTTNQLGNAFSALGLSAFNNALSNAVAGGQLIMLFDLLDLDAPWASRTLESRSDCSARCRIPRIPAPAVSTPGTWWVMRSSTGTGGRASD